MFNTNNTYLGRIMLVVDNKVYLDIPFESISITTTTISIVSDSKLFEYDIKRVTNIRYKLDKIYSRFLVNNK